MLHKQLVKQGVIAGFLWQGVLIVAEGTGQDNKAKTYRPDIVVLRNDGTYTIREDKGYRTKEYKVKRQVIANRYPNIVFEEV